MFLELLHSICILTIFGKKEFQIGDKVFKVFMQTLKQKYILLLDVSKKRATMEKWLDIYNQESKNIGFHQNVNFLIYIEGIEKVKYVPKTWIAHKYKTIPLFYDFLQIHN